MHSMMDFGVVLKILDNDEKQFCIFEAVPDAEQQVAEGMSGQYFAQNQSIFLMSLVSQLAIANRTLELNSTHRTPENRPI
jgi:hypothetical protein